MNKPKTKIENIVVQEFENEVLIYDLTINKAFCLNKTSAMIWELCDGTKSVAEISQILIKKLNEPISEDLVWLALDQFKRDNLLENNEQFEINFNGLNRRQVIKKIGFASLVALPVIGSVVAPVAAATASLLPLGSSCLFLSPSACQSNNCVNTNIGTQCCAAGVGSGAVYPGAGTCTPPGTCLTTFATRCCTQMGSFLGTPNNCAPLELELCGCN